MIVVEHLSAEGFESAIRGMRNPLNSWAKSDSYRAGDGSYVIGANDLGLMQRLYKGGTEHRKFMRQILASMDITAPLYWIAEFDTYKIGTTRNSCSFMHKGVSKPFELSDFSTHMNENGDELVIWNAVIANLNSLRDEYLKTKDETIFQQIRCLLPSGYNQRFTVSMNYEVACSMIRQRSAHRLEEWHTFIDELKKLPYLAQIMEGSDGTTK